MTQVIALWLSFLPTASIIGLIVLAGLCGDRSTRRPSLTIRRRLPTA